VITCAALFSSTSQAVAERGKFRSLGHGRAGEFPAGRFIETRRIPLLALLPFTREQLTRHRPAVATRDGARVRARAHSRRALTAQNGEITRVRYIEGRLQYPVERPSKLAVQSDV